MNLLPRKFRGAPRCLRTSETQGRPQGLWGALSEGAEHVPWDFHPRLRREAETRVPGELEKD